MRRISSILLVCSLCLVALLVSMVFLAETYPLRPGSLVYSLQHSAEQWRLKLAPSAERRADFAVTLAERRLADLALVREDSRVLASIQAFDQALNQAILQLSDLPDQAAASLTQRMDSLLLQADIVLSAFTPDAGMAQLQDLAHKVAALRATENRQDLAALAQQSPSLPNRITAELISFLGKEVDHGAFPMNGGHAGLACIDCHTNGEFAGTPARCSFCHALPVVRALSPAWADPDEAFAAPLYPNHFKGDCEDCHRVSSWLPYAFDHQGVSECLSCHAHDLPQLTADPDLPMVVFVSSAPYAAFGKSSRERYRADHYPGECAACHTDTANWDVAAFEHTGVRECFSCHEQETPERYGAGHYSGRCVDCHNDFEDWSVADFNHNGHVDCLSCHTDESPVEHYNGQCSSCHDTTRWDLAIFNHSGYDDCRSCHDRPVKHYPGQCSTCHDPATWELITFTHRHTSDCSSCHDSPAGHYDASCSTCHTTTDWKRSLFSHSIYSSCSTCHSGEMPDNHYTLECSTCHSFSEWSSISFSHDGRRECETCHQPPENHFPGACANCHMPVSWAQIVFDHEGFSDCLSCHTADVGHYAGLCSNCHNTIDWQMIDFDHTGYTDCMSCHETPAGHWPGQCSDCHSTADWLDITFDHTTYTNCKACHARPAGHPRGQCSNCHTTDTWIIATPTPAVLLPATPVVQEERYVRPELPSDEEPDLRATPVPDSDVPTVRVTPEP